ncbi:MAG: folate-binding protein [Gammaproteobacteria bacterium]|nr:MAG: folate-binding protein [Gammaproteobacteria bacterium]
MNKTYLCDLSNLGLIRASGEETQTFLHGQFTNDLNLVTENISQLSSYCNPKGRMLSIFRVFMRGNDYFLLMPRDVIEATLKKLTMFKLMAKVDLTDVSDEFSLFGLAGPDTDSFLKENNLSIPGKVDQSEQTNETTIIRIPSDNSRVIIISKPENATAIQESLSANLETSSIVWELEDIQNGIPQITAETSEAFIPQMVNLELIGGVNFQKGCYPGQEIVARTHYLGKPNRRMYRISINSENCPSPGTNIFSIKDGEQPVGKIVSAQKSSSDDCQALAVMRTEKENADDLHIDSLSGRAVTIMDLPYSLEVTK